jgi:mannose-6-phosphate isomerase-like protein (cupin superfamily)
MTPAPHELHTRPIHLGLGATAEVEPPFTGDVAWYAAYGERHAADGAEARLVSLHRFDSSWDVWEMHPRGSEVVLCIEGRLILHQQHPASGDVTVRLAAGEYAINAAGVWHTADVDGSATAVFITAGIGTEHRPR